MEILVEKLKGMKVCSGLWLQKVESVLPPCTWVTHWVLGVYGRERSFPPADGKQSPGRDSSLHPLRSQHTSDSPEDQGWYPRPSESGLT